MPNNTYPIFPLTSIVLPEGLFPLRIFERRYLDMVKACIKNNEGFCIALAKNEIQEKYINDIYQYSSFVKIVDWNQLEDGILGITVEGISIVKVLSSKLNKDNLLMGEIEFVKTEKEYLIPQKYLILSKFYKKIYPGIKNFINFKKERYSNASWVGFRLVECLPLDLYTKANLISTNNALDRLEIIHNIVNKIYKDEIKDL
tara:strand:- start:219 stop:821 length:603 start_codon:yes stop_codon:yes gene_type:complete